MSRHIVIVGGTQAGPTAAARAREIDDDARITIVQRGGHLSFGFTGLHHHLAGEVGSLAELDREDAAFFEQSYGVQALLHTEAIGLNVAGRTLTVRSGGVESALGWDSLVFALGAESSRLEAVRGDNVFTLRSLADAAALVKARAQGARRAVVVGGGSFGLEAVDGLTRAGFEVTLVEERARLLPRFGAQVASALREALAQRATVITGERVVGADHAQGRVTAVQLASGRRVETDLVVVCAGVRPRTELLREAGVGLRPDGTVAVDERAAVAGAPGVFACGASVSVPDAVSGQHRWWAQAAIADKVAQAAGENAAGGDARMSRFTGTMVVRVGDVAVGRVGLSAAEARSVFGDDDVDTSLVPGRTHDAWFPASQPLLLELISRRSTGTVLGAEACGGAVDRRLDVVAVAIAGGLTVETLAGIDLCAAGAFGGARDVVNTAATLAVVERRGGGRSITPTDLLARTDWQIVDLRSAPSDDPGLVGAVRIPLAELRARYRELDPARPTVVHCTSGRAGWLAMRMLRQRGFADVSNLSGGLAALRREHGAR